MIGIYNVEIRRLIERWSELMDITTMVLSLLTTAIQWMIIWACVSAIADACIKISTIVYG